MTKETLIDELRFQKATCAEYCKQCCCKTNECSKYGNPHPAIYACDWYLDRQLALINVMEEKERSRILASRGLTDAGRENPLPVEIFITQGWYKGSLERYAMCPVCDNNMYEGEEQWLQPYCCSCGQRLSWSVRGV